MALPKWIGWLATVVAIATAAWSSSHPGMPLPAWIVAAMAVINQFTHSTSIPLTGGKPQ